MSTNDSVFVLANGLAEEPADHRAEPAPDLLARLRRRARRDLLDELARAIAADGEGATKRLETVRDRRARPRTSRATSRRASRARRS